MGKKFLSAVLSLALIAMSAPAAGVVASADETTPTEDYNLAGTTAEGVILHTFNWSYNTIKDNLPAIAEAGYTSIQTSPVQQPKNFCDSKDTSGQWWKLYQPLSFSVAEESWLGTKADLTDLCTEAEKYGIKIICDIVSNHMANNEAGDSYTYYEGIADYEPEIYNNLDKYFHSLRKNVDDSKIQYLVQGTLDGVPDLNTSEEYVQSRVISLLEECIDCGVDGFRFDAAKHIETPEDGEFASDYWPNVINAAREYAQNTTGQDIFCYGEILNSPGNGRSITAYLPYINVTDNKAGDATLAQVVKGNADKIVTAQNYSYADVDPSSYVIWAESHDTYMGSSGSAGISNTADVDNEYIAKAWAIIAARSQSTSLYLARPGVIMGEAGDSSWKSTAVSEINKFHNKFIGTDDKIYADGDVVAVQRGDSGIVLVNVGGTDAEISVTTQAMKDGAYTDAITGNTFEVAGGVITGKIGSTGIAVVYEGAETTPRVNFSKDDTAFKTDTISVVLTLENAAEGTYSINGSEPIQFTDSVKVVIGEGSVPGDVFTLTATATDGEKTTTNTHTYKKEAGTGTGVFVYFDNTGRNFKNVCVYAFYEEKDSSNNIIYSTANGSWPGVLMDYDEEAGLYFYELPEDLKVGEARIIFSDGGANQTSQNGHRLKSDSMIYQNNKWTDYNPDGVTLVYGDVNLDTKVTSVDSLMIQQKLAGLVTFDEQSEACADINNDGKINSLDSLDILRKIAGLSASDLIGTEFTFGGSANNDTDTDTDTEPVSGTMFYAVDSTGWVFESGCKLWVVNNDTNEAIEMKKESPEDDSSKYSYCTLPEGWTNLSLYRTDPYASDISEAYNSWRCGKKSDTDNAYKMTGDGTGSYLVYDPSAEIENMPMTIYFDNSKTNWSEVYIYGWGNSGLGNSFDELELVPGTDNIYTYTFSNEIEAGSECFLFANNTDWDEGKGKQTVNVAGEAGKNLFTVTKISSGKWQYAWDVYSE